MLLYVFDDGLNGPGGISQFPKLNQPCNLPGQRQHKLDQSGLGVRRLQGDDILRSRRLLKGVGDGIGQRRKQQMAVIQPVDILHQLLDA